MMGIWRRFWNLLDPYAEVGPTSDIKDTESHLKHELRQLLQQRQAIEQRGCFSDRELEAKDHELEALELRIKALKNQQFRLRTHGRMHV